MKAFIQTPLPGRPDELMQNAGYTFHCTNDGKPCYHRRLNEPAFPRFHAYVTTNEKGMEIDLHFDQLNLDRSSNHQYQWAYEGERVHQELDHIVGVIRGTIQPKHVARPATSAPPKKKPKSDRKRSLFELIFKT